MGVLTVMNPKTRFLAALCGTAIASGALAQPLGAIDLGAVATSDDIFAIGSEGSSFDTELGLWAADGTFLGTDDDSGTGLTSLLSGLTLPAGEYFFSVSGFSSTNFANGFAVTVAPTSASGQAAGVANATPWNTTIDPGEAQFFRFEVLPGQGGSFCPPTTTITENEPDCGLPDDSVNGGCNGLTFLTQPLVSGDVFCGTGAFDGASRDTDWFEIVLTETSTVTWTVTARFASLAGIVDSGGIAGDGFCATGAFVSSDTANAGETATATAVLGPGTWYLFAAPDFLANVICGTEYFAEVNIEPFVITPPANPIDLGTIAGPTDTFSINSAGSDFDTELGLWDANGALIATNDDVSFPADVTSIISDLTLPTGQYFFSISGFNTIFAFGFSATIDAGLGGEGGNAAGTANATAWSTAVAPDSVVFYTFNIGDAACPADFNGDTVPGDIFDLFDFLAALDNGLDFNGDTTPADIFDLFDFLAVLDAGCP